MSRNHIWSPLGRRPPSASHGRNPAAASVKDSGTDAAPPAARGELVARGETIVEVHRRTRALVDAGLLSSSTSPAAADAARGGPRGSRLASAGLGVISKETPASNSKPSSPTGPAAGTQQKLLILDWDDTVLPTTYLAQKGITHKTQASDVPKAVRDELRKYAYRVKATLSLLEGHGRVVIVTNANEGWVELSCSRFLPEIEPLIRSFRRVSARPAGFHEKLEEIKPKEWKEEAFVNLAMKHFAYPIGQPVFSLGDASWEREAVRMTSARLGVVSQSLKLLEHPSIEALEEVHVSLQEDGYLEKLLRRKDSFDLYFDLLDGPKPYVLDPETRPTEQQSDPRTERPKSSKSDSPTETPKSCKSTGSTSTRASTSGGDVPISPYDSLCGRQVMTF